SSYASPAKPYTRHFPYTTLFRSEVDESQHAEDEADADGHQRVDRALRGRVRDRLPVDGHPKYAATSLSVSWASPGPSVSRNSPRSEEHTSELQSHLNLVCRLLLE